MVAAIKIWAPPGSRPPRLTSAAGGRDRGARWGQGDRHGMAPRPANMREVTGAWGLRCRCYNARGANLRLRWPRCHAAVGRIFAALQDDLRRGNSALREP